MFTGPKIVRDGLIFGYDADDKSERFYKGEPTTNLFTGAPSVYNNVPGHVTVILEATSDTYKGATIYKETITPLTSDGVSWLQNGNNPGIGVMHSYRNFVANNYMGYSIFYKPTVAMYTNPIFNQYSNIGGWQNPYSHDDMGDGWYRAWTTWYDTVSRNDSKFWAINPLTATIGVPIIIYWAGMFIENLNQNFVSKYTLTSRSNTDSLIDLKNTSTIDLSNMSYNSTGQPIFNGSNFIKVPYNQILNTTNGNTVECIVNIQPSGNWQSLIQKPQTNNAHTANYFDYAIYASIDGSLHTRIDGEPSTSPAGVYSFNKWNHIIITWSNKLVSFYVNNKLVWSCANSKSTITFDNNTDLIIGGNAAGGERVLGQIPIVRIYNYALSEDEINQNYYTLKNRFNLQ